jgi:LacI family transcriptional regulator
VLSHSLPSTPERPAGVFARGHGEELGLDVLSVDSSASVAGAAAAATDVLTLADPPTAVFCMSDSMAYGCYLAAHRLGLTIPRELSVLGYDDHETAELVVPPLSTFHWDERGIVEAAVTQLVAAIEDGAGRRTRTFRPEFVQRASTAHTREGRSSSV